MYWGPPLLSMTLTLHLQRSDFQVVHTCRFQWLRLQHILLGNTIQPTTSPIVHFPQSNHNDLHECTSGHIALLLTDLGPAGLFQPLKLHLLSALLHSSNTSLPSIPPTQAFPTGNCCVASSSSFQIITQVSLPHTSLTIYLGTIFQSHFLLHNPSF